MSNSPHFTKCIIKLNLELVSLLSLVIYVVRYHPRITNIAEPPGRNKKYVKSKNSLTLIWLTFYV